MDRKKLISAGKKLLHPAMALLAAFAVTSVIILVIGYSPLSIFSSIFKGAFGNGNAFLSTLFRMTPILFTGLAFSVAVRAGLINIGVEGRALRGSFYRDAGRSIWERASAFDTYHAGFCRRGCRGGAVRLADRVSEDPLPGA